MSSATPAVRTPLRAVGGHGGHRAPAANVSHLARGRLRVADGRRRVIVVGGGLARRRSVREQVLTTMGDARVCETTDLWSVLAQAPTSQLVILLGDLDEAPVRELERLLGHRHPELTVLTPASGPESQLAADPKSQLAADPKSQLAADPKSQLAADPKSQPAGVARPRRPAAQHCADAVYPRHRAE